MVHGDDNCQQNDYSGQVNLAGDKSGPQGRVHLTGEIPGQWEGWSQPHRLMLCLLHLVQVCEVKAGGSRLSSDQLCHLPGEQGPDSAPHFHSWRWVRWIAAINKMRNMLCFVLYSRYPNSKWHDFLSFCFFLCFLALMHISGEKTHPFQSCHFVSPTPASLCTNPLTPKTTSITGVIGSVGWAFDVTSSGFLQSTRPFKPLQIKDQILSWRGN